MRTRKSATEYARSIAREHCFSLEIETMILQALMDYGDQCDGEGFDRGYDAANEEHEMAAI